MKFTKVLGSVIALFLGQELVAQNQKFSDIFPVVQSGNTQEAIPLLVNFLSADPTHPAANLQLALLYEKRYLEFDPLTEVKAALNSAEQAKYRYTQAAAFIDEKDVRRNTDDYGNFAVEFKRNGKPIVELDTVANKVRQGYKMANDFLERTPIIAELFSKSVSHYDRSTKLFRKIVGEYKSLKDIYLFYDDQMANQLNELKMSYDSAVFYFDQYQKTLEDYPYKKRKQKLVVSDILTYRLHGIVSQTDFLLKEIPVWNYSKWVDEVNKVIDTEIKQLRNEIETAHSELIASQDLLKSKKPTKDAEEEILQPIDQKLILKMRKYDLNSVTAGLFQYQKEKLIILNDAWRVSEIKEEEDIEAINKLQFFSRSFNRIDKADEALDKVMQLNNSYNLDKYKSFIDKKYDGLNGFESFLNAEKKFILEREDFLAENIFTSLVEVSRLEDDERYVSFKGTRIPFFAIDTLTDAEVGTHITTHKVKSLDGNYYLAGYEVLENEGTQAFLAKVSAGANVLWILKPELEIDDPSLLLNRNIGDLLLTPKGAILALHTYWPEIMAARNSIVFVSQEGEITDQWTFDWLQFPRKILYNDILGRYTIVLKGQDKQENIEQVESIVIYQLDETGYELWSHQQDLIGNLLTAVNLPNGIVVSSRVETFRDEDGNVQDFSERPALLVYKIDPSGQMDGKKLVRPNRRLAQTTMFKISDDFITIADLDGNSGQDALLLFTAELEMKYNRIEE